MAKNYSITDIYSWKFQKLDLPEEWANHLGSLSENFRMLIQGPSGHGKTEYVVKLCKMLAAHYGKVNLNNTEQGRSDTLQQAITRNNMDEVKGKIMLAEKSQRVFDVWFKRLQRPQQGKVIVLDSLDYMELTIDQFKQLHERFPKKSIVIVCWDDPMSIHAKKIKYMCDIKVEVKDFVAHVRSRFGGNEPFIIRDLKKKKQLSLTL